MDDDFDTEMDAWLEEWEAVDAAAAEYLAERVPDLEVELPDQDARWVAALAETISPSDAPAEKDVEAVSAVMALQHADWLALALGVVRRGPGSTIDPEVVAEDVDRLEDVEGEVEDVEGLVSVLSIALLHLTPAWQELGVLDADEQVTERGAWGLPRALYRVWRPRG